MKKLLSALLAVIIIIGIIPVASYAAKTEVPDGYVGVYDIEDLYSVRYALDKNYILMADIDMTEATAEGGDWDNGYGWAPIGEDASIPFTGIFDGNGHTIKGMQIRGIKTAYAGLFGYVNGTIKNINISEAVITTDNKCNYVGTVAGYAKAAEISDILIDVTLTLSNNTQNTYAGGAIGYGDSVSLTDIKVNGELNCNVVRGGNDNRLYSGGIAGYLTGTSAITNCVNNSSVTAFCKGTIYGNYSTYCYTGGITGYQNNTSTVENSYNTGDISSRAYHHYYDCYSHSYSYSGGIASQSDGTIKNCYNTGSISSVSEAGCYKHVHSGGIAGEGNAESCINLGNVTGEGDYITISSIASQTIKNCYYLRGTANYGKHNTTDTATTAVALSETQMKLKSVFGYLDFENVWLLEKGMDYPQLISNPETAIEHTHEYTAVVTEPTCTEQGYTTHTCSCGDSYVDTYVNALGHKYTSKVTKPTCTEQGYTTHTCSCGDSYIDTYVKALGHDFGGWTVTKAATHTEKGEQTRYCSRCEAYETEEIGILGHDYKPVVTAPTCTAKGYTTYTCECGESYVSDYTDAKGHNFGEWMVTTPATCTKKGVETRYCSRCDATETRETELADHDYKAVVTKPTCTEQGYTTYTCSCGDSYVADYVDATGHIDGVWNVTKAATYTEEGVKTLYCKECGKPIRTEVIPKLTGRVVSVSINNVEVKYKTSAVIKPEIKTEGNIKYTVKYESSDPKIATVDQNGNITTNHKGTAMITCTVTDEANNVVKDTKLINVKFSFGQWLIWIFLFGFLWY